MSTSCFLAGTPAVKGAGYGFECLSAARWLHKREIFYWGDIDTHGFAILNQLRASFPGVKSVLMDRETLMSHRVLWGTEPQPRKSDLSRLTSAEKDLYDDLRYDRLAHSLRLEQERIGFSWVEQALQVFRKSPISHNGQGNR